MDINNNMNKLDEVLYSDYYLGLEKDLIELRDSFYPTLEFKILPLYDESGNIESLGVKITFDRVHVDSWSIRYSSSGLWSDSVFPCFIRKRIREAFLDIEELKKKKKGTDE